MKTTPLNTIISPLSFAGRVARNIALAGSLSFAIAIPNAIADEEMEWDPTWGLHEEEWYDPSDWFNEDESVNYEDYGYDDTYYTDTYWNSNDYYTDYRYNSDGYDPVTTGTDTYYQWSPADQNWSEVKGDKAESEKRSAAAKEMSSDSKTGSEAKSIDKKDVMTMRGTIKNLGTAKTKGHRRSIPTSSLSLLPGKTCWWTSGQGRS